MLKGVPPTPSNDEISNFYKPILPNPQSLSLQKLLTTSKNLYSKLSYEFSKKAMYRDSVVLCNRKIGVKLTKKG